MKINQKNDTIQPELNGNYMSVLFFKNKNFPNAKSGRSFDEDFSFHHENGVAFYNENAFFASGVNHGGSVHYLSVSNPTLPLLKEWVQKTFGDDKPTESEYVVGTAYKRICRPVATGGFRPPLSEEKFTESYVSLRILLNKLTELFETVEPTEANLSTYGHKIREVLLLACMEVESSWVAVLKENEYVPTGQFSTNDYVKLHFPMLLDCYELSLQSYPHFPSLTPFKKWDSKNPTKSLVWYDAYNKTKHDREENLKFATVSNAVQAVAAVVVMFYAQFGYNFGMGFNDQRYISIRNVFSNKTDYQEHWQECYVAEHKVDTNTSPNPHATGSWHLINYPF